MTQQRPVETRAEPGSADVGTTPAESRRKVRAVGFVALTLLGAALCVYVAFPLLIPILWAGVLATMALPLHRWLERRLQRASWTAALSTAALAVLVALPFALVAAEMLLQGSEALAQPQGEWAARLWQEFQANHPKPAWRIERLGGLVDLKGVAGEWTGGAAKMLRALVAGSIATVTGWLIMIFILFHFLRDRARLVAEVERYLPLSRGETDEVFTALRDSIHATVWGTVGVALLQGTLGGLVFWWLGLPAPLLWGAVMGVLSVLPVLGAAFVWAPVAAFLALQGNWLDAGILIVFGAIVIGLIDNLVYPLIVKGRIRLHTVPVFVSIIGGLIVFGASGIVLGPVLLATTAALIRIWRRRLNAADDRSAG